MTVILRSTPYGRRAFPIDTNEAEHLVVQGKATKLAAFLYRALDAPPATEAPPIHTARADLEAPDDHDESDPPKPRGRPRKTE